MNNSQFKQMLTFLAVGTLLYFFSINISVNNFNTSSITTIVGIVFLCVACFKLKETSKLYLPTAILAMIYGVSLLIVDIVGVEYSTSMDVNNLERIPEAILEALPLTLTIESISMLAYVAGAVLIISFTADIARKYCKSHFSLGSKRRRQTIIWGSISAAGTLLTAITAMPVLRMTNMFIDGKIQATELLSKMAPMSIASLLGATGVIGFFVMAILVTVYVFKIRKFATLEELTVQVEASVESVEVVEEDPYKIKKDDQDNWEEEIK